MVNEIVISAEINGKQQQQYAASSTQQAARSKQKTQAAAGRSKPQRAHTPRQSAVQRRSGSRSKNARRAEADPRKRSEKKPEFEPRKHCRARHLGHLRRPRALAPSALTFLHLIDTLLEHVHPLPPLDVGVPPLIHRTERDVYAQPVGRVGHDGLRAEVVDPVEVGEGGGDVVPRQQEVDGVWLARTDGLGEGAADPGGGGGGEEGLVVAGASSGRRAERDGARRRGTMRRYDNVLAWTRRRTERIGESRNTVGSKAAYVAGSRRST